MTNAYRPAPWAVIERDPTDRRFMMVHNCYTGKTFRLQRRLAGSPLGEGADERWRRFMIAEKLLVRKRDVTPLLRQRLDEVMHGLPLNEASAVFIPTDACQLACEYCYNENVRVRKGKRRLAPEKMARRFVRYYTSKPAQFWSLTVTGGGEPFLAVDYVYKVARGIQEEAWNLGREFSMKVVTNAQAMTPQKARKLMRAGMVKMQTTIDPLHDESRPMKKGGASLETILHNLAEAPKELEITIGSNVRAGGEAAFARLLERLAPLRGRVRAVNPILIMEQIEGNGASNGRRVTTHFGRKEIKTMIECGKAVDAAGFRRRSVYPRIQCEAFTMCEDLFVNYAGEETFCPGLDNMEPFRTDGMGGAEAGNLFDMRLENPQWRGHCFTGGEPCAYLTKCWGGCRMISVTRGNGWDSINCEKMYFDTITRHEMRNWSVVE